MTRHNISIRIPAPFAVIPAWGGIPSVGRAVRVHCWEGRVVRKPKKKGAGMTGIPPAIRKHVSPGTPHLKIYSIAIYPRCQVLVGENAPMIGPSYER